MHNPGRRAAEGFVVIDSGQPLRGFRNDQINNFGRTVHDPPSPPDFSASQAPPLQCPPSRVARWRRSVSVAAVEARHRLSARRLGRHYGAPHRPVPRREARPVGHRGKPAGWRHQYRDRNGDQRACRRLYASARRARERDQCDALRKAQSQLPARHDADRRADPVFQRDRGEPLRPGHHRSGADRASESQSRQTQHGLVWQRLDHPHVGRAVQDDDRHRHDPRAVSRRRARAHRYGRRAGAGDVRQHSDRGQFIKSGKLQGLAVTSTERSHVLPELPTVAQYVPGYEASAWYGLGAPKTRRPKSSRR